MKSIEIFLNFPIYDINRNLVRDNPKTIKESHKERMDSFWGDHSWYDHLYVKEYDLFDNNREGRINPASSVLPKEFGKRLKEVAGFKYVPKPILMKNTKCGILYYLFFASHQSLANKIVTDIFRKWEGR